MVIDKQYEMGSIAVLGTYQVGYEGDEPWFIPRDIERNLEDLMSGLLEMNWNPPTVRAVQDHEGILGLGAKDGV